MSKSLRHVVLYRRCNNLKDDHIEIEALLAAGFVYLQRRTEIQKDDLVVARYSAVPFYNELEKDCTYVGAKLINSLAQHNYIADLQNYVSDLKELTPETWDSLDNLPDDCSFVLKGGTNSKKGHWRTSMFAQNKKEAYAIYNRLQDDSLIGTQQIYIRKFVPLYTYFEDVQGMPVTKEFRFFICNNQILSGGYYWSSHIEELVRVPSIDEVPALFLDKAMKRIACNVNAPTAYVMDVGIKVDGEPIVIELNDLQQSGLSENDPFLFYKKLKSQLETYEN